jgi:hypothetical protein
MAARPPVPQASHKASGTAGNSEGPAWTGPSDNLLDAQRDIAPSLDTQPQPVLLPQLEHV